jgi:hypothetical protein
MVKVFFKNQRCQIFMNGTIRLQTIVVQIIILIIKHLDDPEFIISLSNTDFYSGYSW